MSTKEKEPLTFGDFIRSHRMGEGLTQVELSEFLGISKQRLCDIEKNRTNISLKLCREFAEKLGLPYEWLAKLSIQDQINKEGLNLKVS
jgi:DNA-binding XRE family transcriptional regulator